MIFVIVTVVVLITNIVSLFFACTLNDLDLYFCDCSVNFMVAIGFCLKTKTDAGDKVFINICQGANVSECEYHTTVACFCFTVTSCS